MALTSGGDELSAGAQINRPLKVVLGKPGLDGHNVGVKVVARILRDAGFDVVYLGLRIPVKQIVEAAIQEDADLIGISNLSGALVGFVAEAQKELADAGVDIPVIVGGSLTPDDVARLEELKVDGIFGPGTNAADIAETATRVARACAERKIRAL